jgi:hypothetical protein
MKNLLTYFIFFAVVTMCFWSCERDDICPASEPTTPFLVIEFFDNTEPEENLNVQSFGYVVEGSTDTIVLGTTDSIALPLDTNQNTTRIQFIRNTGNPNIRNSDTLEFIYQVNEVYVNRACGFKATYSNLSAIREIETPSTDNWIRSIIVEEINVENEQNTHVFIFH